MGFVRLRRLVFVIAASVLACGCGEGPRERWKSAYVEANGIRLHYWRTGEGSGKPVIVAAHGISDSALCWMSLAMDMEDDYDFVLYDARGHGLSDKRATGYKIEDHAADLAGLIAGLGLERPVLMGHSMGGAIVAVTAVEHPALPLAVIMVDAAWLRAPADAAAHTAAFRKWLNEVHGKSVDELMDLVKDENPGWPFEDWKPWAESKTQVSLNVVRTYEDLPALEKYFPRLDVPTLVLEADLGPGERQQDLVSASLLPQGEMIHIGGARHSVHRDKPVETRRAIRNFLRSEPLWKVVAAYRNAAGFTLEVDVQGRDRRNRKEYNCRLHVVRSGPAGGRATSFQFEGTGTSQPPAALADQTLPTGWLELDRAARLTNIHDSGSRTVDVNGVRSEYDVVGGRANTGDWIEFWIERDTGLVGRVIVNGPTQWTLTITSTRMGGQVSQPSPA